MISRRTEIKINNMYLYTHVQEIKPGSITKFLGERLEWSDHINYIKISFQRLWGLTTRPKYFSNKSLIKLY